VEMFEAAIARHGAPRIVHADSGPAMRSNLLLDALTSHGVELSHNRPYVSNDNPFSESGFRTMKYRPGYPRTECGALGFALLRPSSMDCAAW
jgi:transposase InsO family protein